MIDDVFWTVDDALAGRCAMSDVGSRKPDVVHDDAAVDPDAPISEQLKRDALTAYKLLGGTEYLKKNPQLLDKALLKMIAEPVQESEMRIKITIDAPWMNPNRLSYRRELAADIQPISYIERAAREAQELAEAKARHAERAPDAPEMLLIKRRDTSP